MSGLLTHSHILLRVLRDRVRAVLVAGKWQMAASISAFPFGNLEGNRNKKLLDIEVNALYDADHDVVAPHGEPPLIRRAYGFFAR